MFNRGDRERISHREEAAMMNEVANQVLAYVSRDSLDFPQLLDVLRCFVLVFADLFLQTLLGPPFQFFLAEVLLQYTLQDSESLWICFVFLESLQNLSQLDLLS